MIDKSIECYGNMDGAESPPPPMCPQAESLRTNRVKQKE